ncbi:hypothetical protein T12_3172 [Trichinella patagoniensis]|uniref:Uncharacterized protein n=1 Tax=Trichinella patagoniensis TaxID=990121 RepID=A0A0V0Z6B6_9BILA|nr:hypothetical protein T12_3172 [Trichinella patagoniensis]
MKAESKGQLGSTDDTNGEERGGERWAVVTPQAYAETTSHTQRHTVLCPLTFTRWEISPWKSCGLLRARGNRSARKRLPDKNTALPRRRHVAECRICLATQLLNPCLRNIGELRLVTVNETCSDLT